MDAVFDPLLSEHDPSIHFFPISQNMAAELLILCFSVPMLFANLRAWIDNDITCTDASSYGGAFVLSPNVPIARALWLNADFKGRHQHIQGMSFRYLKFAMDYISVVAMDACATYQFA